MKQPVLSMAEERSIESVLQGWVISAISSSKKEYGKWVFHGGTALKKAFQGVRYSEDLDFMVEPNLDTKLLMQKVVDQISVLAVITYGPKAEIRLKSRPGDKNPQMFHVVMSLPDLTMSAVRVKVEFSETLGLAAYATTSLIVSPEASFVRNTAAKSDAARVEVGDLEQIFIDKWIALTMRPEIKHRDVWDLSWLLEKKNLQQMTTHTMWARMQDIVKAIYPQNDQTQQWAVQARERFNIMSETMYLQQFKQDMQRWLDPDLASLPDHVFADRVYRVLGVFEGLVHTMEESYGLAQNRPD